MATASGAYATLLRAKERLNNPPAGDDSLIQSLCEQVNGWIESKTGRVLAPITYTAQLFDGMSALENGRLLPLPNGIRTISLLRVAQYTGGPLSTVPSTDYFIRPIVPERDVNWPGTELWMTDVPSSTNSTPVFARGFNNIELTGAGGWAAVPDEITSIALNLVTTLYRRRGVGGGGDSISVGPDGSRTISLLLDAQDWRTINRFTSKTVSVI